ncbi:ABC transporter ATP-binding protein [Paenibacillus turpanensis]|uniref:ABC transporter ATP-binding protein n=1 Tax=Paenibacillus turpanensis TaxID=2689078 RepID=UPI00140BB2E1|nr:ABC transporter ATP-binding protein [Paenibacillus turpanensis]
MGGGPGGPGAGNQRGMLPKERAKNAGAALRRLWGYLGRQRSGLVGVGLLTVLVSGLTLAGPYWIGYTIDHYIDQRDEYGLLRACLQLIGIYAAASLFTWLQAYVMAGVSQGTVRELRGDLFAWLQKLPVPFFDRRTHGDLMSRATNDIDNVSQALNQSVTQFLSSILTLIGAFAMMIYLEPMLALLSLLVIPLVMAVTGFVARHTRSHFKGQQQHLGALNGFIQETVSGQKAVQVFRREERCAEQFDDINASLRKAAIQAQIYSGFMGPVMNVMNNLSFAFIAFAGGWMIHEGWTTIGIVVSFLNYTKQFTRPINELATQYNMLQSGIAGAERVFQVMDTEPEPDDGLMPDSALTSQPIRGHVCFKHVTFGYTEGQPILRDVSLTAHPGETIALVGPTGAGKTTIVNLLTRFYEIQEGEIRIDGRSIAEFEKSELRRLLGIVLQDAHLFTDTIRENIRYGRLDASDEDVEAAARMANADAFIRKLPDGYNTVLSAEGGNVSHGQRQLITIARAILANPAILILDEATSSIDTRTEMQIQEALSALRQGRTSFVIAHRLSTIRDADQILFISGGEIAERGTHEQLLAQRGLYYELYTSQFAKAI